MKRVCLSPGAPINVISQLVIGIFGDEVGRFFLSKSNRYKLANRVGVGYQSAIVYQLIVAVPILDPMFSLVGYHSSLQLNATSPTRIGNRKRDGSDSPSHGYRANSLVKFEVPTLILDLWPK